MSPELIFQIVGGLAVILFLVAVSMSYKTWRAHTIVLVCLNFLAAAVMFWLSVQVLKTQQAWRSLLHEPPENLIARTEKTLQDVREIQFGVKDDEGKVVEDGIEQLDQKLRTALLDRGRIWQNCQPISVNGGTVQIEITDPKPHQITANLIVFAFDSKPKIEGGSYLGEFKVVDAGAPPADAPADAAAAPAAPAAPAAAAASPVITLENVWPMSAREQARLNAAQGGPWIICDKMPADGEYIFRDTDVFTATDLGVTEAELAALDRYERLKKFLPSDSLAEYQLDGQPADMEKLTDPDRIRVLADHPERVEVLVEFNEDYRYRDDEFSYKEDQRVWLPKVTAGERPGADELAKKGIVEIVEDAEPRYARELRDYAHTFRDIYTRTGERRIRIDDITFDTDAVNVILNEKTAIITKNEEEIARLTNDKDGFLRDKAILEDLLAKLNAQRLAIGRRMLELRQQNAVLAKQLDDLQMQAVEAINRRYPAPQASIGTPSPAAAAAR